MIGHARKHLSTILVAMVTAAVTASAPAIAHGVKHALFAHDSDKVDGLHAVKSDASKKKRKGKLVATDPQSGKFPTAVIPKADADTLDGKDSTAFQDRVTGTCPNQVLVTIHANGSVTCEEDDNTTYTAASGGGLSLGGTGGTQFSVDSTVQRRTASGAFSCPLGQYLRAVAPDGSPACGTDQNSGGTITGVTAGTGLTGGGTSGSVTLGANFGGNGSATTIARSDHNHDATYINANGSDTMTGNLTVTGTMTLGGLLTAGTGTGTSETPGMGMIARRTKSSSTTAGQVLARTDTVRLERDGTTGGLRWAWDNVAQIRTGSCLGITSSSTVVSDYSDMASGTSGTNALFSDAQDVVHVECMFGYSQGAGHVTHVSLQRTSGTSTWVGYLESSFNQ